MALNPNPSLLDSGQIFKRAFDGDNDRLRVDAQISATIAGAQEVIITHVDDSIRLGDGTNLVTTTTVSGDVGLDVNVIGGAVTGEFVQTGLHTAGKITTMLVGDTATVIPTTALSDRNSLSLTNMSPTDTLYVGFTSSVEANDNVGILAGWNVGPNEGFNLDIRDNIILYGICETGKTVKIKVMELA